MKQKIILILLIALIAAAVVFASNRIEAVKKTIGSNSGSSFDLFSPSTWF